MTPKPAPPPSLDDPFDYIERRVTPQRKWHAAKARWNRRRFHAMEITTLVAGALIPIVNLLGLATFWAGLFSGLLGGLVVIATALGKLFKFHENWLQYRALVETLDREVELYVNSVADYASGGQTDRNRLFVERVENLLATNTANYVATQRGNKVPASAASTRTTNG